MLGLIAGATDLLPPRIRYGYVHPLTRRMMARPLPVVTGPGLVRPAVSPRAHGAAPGVTCALAVDDLDIGGIGAVIEMLCDGLPSEGVTPVVLGTGDGPRAQRLRRRGIDVVTVSDQDSAERALREIGPAVVQLHSAPRFVEEAVLGSGLPFVPVLHNTEIHYTRARWRQFRKLLGAAAAAVAVSETVSEFHRRHVQAELGDRIVVVPNGAPLLAAVDGGQRASARRGLAACLGLDPDVLGDDVVFVCLARYDSQKNIAGTVASFLRAAEAGDRAGQHVRLVIAGDPSDWVELLRADAARRCSARGADVHLLGNSDPGGLLAAADVFLLNSFFEGWPVAATEAAAIGLPLLLSDVGGAAELVGQDGGRSALVPNPCGAAAAVSDSRVRAARRRARDQVNADEVSAAVLALADAVRRATPASPTISGPAGISVAAMAAGHARVLASVLTPPASDRAAAR